jgi:hypothetical protein
MPVVHIYMYAGRSKEQKSEMVRRISKDFEEVLNVKTGVAERVISRHGEKRLGHPWRAGFRSAVEVTPPSARGKAYANQDRFYRLKRSFEPTPRQLQSIPSQRYLI